VVVGQFDLTRTVTIGIAPFFGLTIKGHQNSAVPYAKKRQIFEELCSLVIANELVVEVERVPIEQISDAWVRLGRSAPVKMTVIP
jgi:hypothetical protein